MHFLIGIPDVKHQYSISACKSYLESRSRPFRNVSSMMKQQPTTSPPRRSTSCSPIASTVPPVARTSSWMRTRAPWGIMSGCSSSAFCPYSRAYVALIVSGGSFPGRRAGTKPQPISRAIAAPRMKPRASAPRITSGFWARAHPASSAIVWSSACGSASSGVTSLKPTPGCGQSGTSRIFSFRFTALAYEVAQTAPEEALRQILRELAEHLQVARPLLPPLRVARAERRRDRGCEQPGLAVGGRAERAQVSRRDAEAREPAADRGDLGVGLAVEALASRDPRRQQAVLLELAGQAPVDAGALAEGRLVELRLRVAEAARAPPPALR